MSRSISTFCVGGGALAATSRGLSHAASVPRKRQTGNRGRLPDFEPVAFLVFFLDIIDAASMILIDKLSREGHPAMTRVPQEVTDAELAVLQVLWNQGQASVRQLMDVLYPEGGASAFATVQK